MSKTNKTRINKLFLTCFVAALFCMVIGDASAKKGRSKKKDDVPTPMRRAMMFSSADLANSYGGTGHSTQFPDLDTVPIIFRVTSRDGQKYEATLEKVGGHRGSDVIFEGEGTVGPQGHIVYRGVTREPHELEIRLTGELSAAGSAIGGLLRAGGNFFFEGEPDLNADGERGFYILIAGRGS